MESINRKQLIGGLIALVAVLLGVEAWVPPPAHAVHSIGGTAVDATSYTPSQVANDDFGWQTGPPSESLNDIECVHISTRERCGPADISRRFPGLRQTAHTLYYAWIGCVVWSGVGPIIPWAGYNVEYFAASRTLVLHCYVGTGLLYLPDRVSGFAAAPVGVLLTIPTSAIGPGHLEVHEDDRLEHLIGDTDSEYRLATAAIS